MSSGKENQCVGKGRAHAALAITLPSMRLASNNQVSLGIMCSAVKSVSFLFFNGIVRNKNGRGWIADMVDLTEVYDKVPVHKLGRLEEQILLYKDFPGYFSPIYVCSTLQIHTSSLDEL